MTAAPFDGASWGQEPTERRPGTVVASFRLPGAWVELVDQDPEWAVLCSVPSRSFARVCATWAEALAVYAAVCQGSHVAKRCACGRSHSETAWSALPPAHDKVRADGERDEVRHCPCGSTLQRTWCVLCGRELMASDGDCPCRSTTRSS